MTPIKLSRAFSNIYRLTAFEKLRVPLQNLVRIKLGMKMLLFFLENPCSEAHLDIVSNIFAICLRCCVSNRYAIYIASPEFSFPFMSFLQTFNYYPPQKCQTHLILQRFQIYYLFAAQVQITIFKCSYLLVLFEFYLSLCSRSLLEISLFKILNLI